MIDPTTENIIERIKEICKQKKIPVSKLEKDLGYGNGYLNPKKVSDIKASRLLEILDYLEISWEEFMDAGTKKFQETQTALLKLKKINPELYSHLFYNPDLNNEKDATGHIDEHSLLEKLNASDDQIELIQEILRLSPEKVSAFLSLARTL